MIPRLQRLFLPPVFDNGEKTRQARILFLMIFSALIASVFFGVLLVFNSHVPAFSLGLMGFLLLTLGSALGLLRAGRLNAAGFLFFISLWAGLTFSATINGGLASPALSSLVLIIAVAGYLVSGGWGLIFAILSLVTLVSLFIIEATGGLNIPLFPPSTTQLFLYHMLNLSMAAASVYFISGRLRKSLQDALAKERLLTEKNRELEEIRTTLEQHISQRTHEINSQKKFYESLVQNSPLAIVSVDRDHNITSCNPAFEKLFGYSQAEMLGHDLDQFVAADEMKTEARSYTQAVIEGENVHAFARRRRRDGTLIDVEIFGVPVMVDGEKIGILGLYHDVTERKLAQDALQESEEKFRIFFEHASIGMVIQDIQGNYLQVNQAFCSLVGYTTEELLTMNCQQITHPDDLAQGAKNTRRLMDGEINYFQLEKRYLHRNGRIVWVTVNISLVRDANGKPERFMGQIQDISARKEVEQRLQYMATHDALTGLPNRILYYDRLNHAIKLAERTSHQLAVVCMDLDAFKLVNDTCGHDTGDRLLKAISRRLSHSLRTSDTVARFGGDEFAFIIEDISDTQSTRLVIQKIQDTFQKPFLINGHSFQVTSSMGVSLYPQDGEDSKSLFMKADQAMYLAKENGRNQVQFFPSNTL